MWVFLDCGFFSLCVKPGDANLITIRARVRDDLLNLRKRYLPGLRIQTGGGTDYPYRAHATRQQVANMLAKVATNLSASNFKHRVQQTQGATRARCYAAVWESLHDLEAKLAEANE